MVRKVCAKVQPAGQPEVVNTTTGAYLSVSSYPTMNNRLRLPLLLLAGLLLAGCSKPIRDTAASPNLVLRLQLDSTQARLNNTGQPAAMPAGHAGQNPKFRTISAHYAELAPGAFTPLGQGAILYRAPETTAGGTNAIDFEQARLTQPGAVWLTLPLAQVPAGSYEWLRVSLAYQQFDVRYFVDTTIGGVRLQQEFDGTVASFVGFNNYIKTLRIGNQDLVVNAAKKQGFWAFATTLRTGANTVPFLTSGQSPEGATTVVNPLFATSPIPQGSCVVTAAFQPGKLVITGKETRDIVVDVSLSVNKSWEWKEVVPDGKWEPAKGEQVVDMGVRGMVPYLR